VGPPRGPTLRNGASIGAASANLPPQAHTCAHKFKARYATFGFSDKANLDDGTVWPVAFALKELTATDEVRIGALVKKAVN